MELSDKVLRVMRAENIQADELQIMVQHSAITSLRGSNRRFHMWLFWTNADLTRVTDMQRADLLSLGKGETRMLEDHDYCHGVGCKDCGWAGVVSRAVADVTERTLGR